MVLDKKNPLDESRGTIFKIVNLEIPYTFRADLFNEINIGKLFQVLMQQNAQLEERVELIDLGNLNRLGCLMQWCTQTGQFVTAHEVTELREINQYYAPNTLYSK